MHSVSRTLASFNNFALSSRYSHHYLKTYSFSSVVFSLSVDKLKAYTYTAETSCIIELLLCESSLKAIYTIDLLLYVAVSLYAIYY